MGGSAKFSSSNEVFEVETLRLDFRKRSIKGQFNVIKFTDKDTKQAVVYLPALELSGYGETFEKAELLLQESATEFFHYITRLSAKEVEAELDRLGWNKTFYNKQYSKASVDINGELQNLNAEGNKIERMSLTAA